MRQLKITVEISNPKSPVISAWSLDWPNTSSHDTLGKVVSFDVTDALKPTHSSSLIKRAVDRCRQSNLHQRGLNRKQGDMSEERKGLSLRTKRQKRPPISAPTPIPQAVQTSQRPTPFGDAKLDLPPQRPRAGGKVCLPGSLNCWLHVLNNYRPPTSFSVDTRRDSTYFHPNSMPRYLLYQAYHQYRMPRNMQQAVSRQGVGPRPHVGQISL